MILSESAEVLNARYEAIRESVQYFDGLAVAKYVDDDLGAILSLTDFGVDGTWQTIDVFENSEGGKWVDQLFSGDTDWIDPDIDSELRPDEIWWSGFRISVEDRHGEIAHFISGLAGELWAPASPNALARSILENRGFGGAFVVRVSAPDVHALESESEQKPWDSELEIL